MTIDKRKTQPMITFNFLDAPMGYGKTTAIINKVNTKGFKGLGNTERFLVVTPYNAEVNRICENSCCVAPVGVKRDEIKSLLASGENICCTHALFALFTNEHLDIIRESGYNYHLIIDEELSLITDIVGYKRQLNKDNPSIIEQYGKDDYTILKKEGLITETDEHEVLWNEEKEYAGVFVDLKKRLGIHRLFRYGKGIIQMPKRSLWLVFTSVTFCSYRMKDSLLSYYCQLNDITVNYQHIENKEIIEGYKALKPKRLDLLHLYTTPKDISYSCSKYFYSNNCRPQRGEKTSKLRRLSAMFRYFRENIVPSSVDKTAYYWTCYKGYAQYFVDKNLAKKRHRPCNMKAVNDLQVCQIIGYFVNRFMKVSIKNFLQQQGIEVNEKEIALSETIQFIWRSAVRAVAPKPVYVFIGSDGLKKDLDLWKGQE